MSLKKDNYKPLDKKIMNFAINLADNNKYLTGTNPSVGCVIVKKKKILSFATTNYGGRPHAESIALSKNKYNNGSSLYSTLEPCSHHGKTPPCTNAIIQSGIKNIIIGAIDPNPKVSGTGINKLIQHGLQVQSGVCESLVEDQNKFFF